MMNQERHSGLGPFIAMIGRHWPAMALGTGLAVLATLAAIGLLALSGWFIAASAVAGMDSATALLFNFWFPSVGVRLLAMLRTAARYGERIVCHDATFRILETLRSWCYRSIEPLMPARLTRLHSGDLLARIITDIDTLDNLYLRMLSPSAVAAATVIIMFGFIFPLSRAVALADAGAMITAGCLIPLLGQGLSRRAARDLNEHNARLRTGLVDGILGLAALVSSGAEHRYLRQMGKRHERLAAAQFQMSRISGLTTALVGLAGGLAVAATLVMGLTAVKSGQLTGPGMALLILAVMAGFDAVVMLPTAYQYLGQTRRAAARLGAVTDMQPAVAFARQSEHAGSGFDIEFRDVTFRYADAHMPSLERINLRIAQGQRLAILGTTGAGKSTLLYLLARFEDPGHGEIRLGAAPLQSYSEKDLRKSLCIIDQRAHIFSGTLRDNLILANPEAQESDLWKALGIVGLNDLVDGLPDGLETWVGEAGRLLSGGQARRLAVARAVLSPAPIWVFDEPTEGLDRETADAMMAALLEKGRGKTIIMVTHRSEALQRMDRVITLQAGRIVAAG